MNALEVFSHDTWQVRTLLVDNEPWFVAADVCAALGLANVTMATQRLDADGVSTTEVIDSMGRTQTARTVNEAGLYELIFQSRRPEAKTFKRWVTHEVLPAIRRTGTYTTTPAAMPTHAEALRGWATAIDRTTELEQQAAVNAPKVDAYTALLDSTGDYSLRQAAQILARDHGIDTGQNRLARSLVTIGWCDRTGQPYQRHIDCGRLAVKVLNYEHPHTGEAIITTQIRVTAKGITALHARLMPKPKLGLIEGGAS